MTQNVYPKVPGDITYSTELNNYYRKTNFLDTKSQAGSFGFNTGSGASYAGSSNLYITLGSVVIGPNNFQYPSANFAVSTKFIGTGSKSLVIQLSGGVAGDSGNVEIGNAWGAGGVGVAQMMVGSPNNGAQLAWVRTNSAGTFEAFTSLAVNVDLTGSVVAFLKLKNDITGSAGVACYITKQEGGSF